ncbi:MAG: alcohol dehydrogenase catalytic domain-containing protein, partial [Myxococcota bacterium]
MKAIAYLAPGAPDVLDLHDVPAPEPGPGDLLVDVRAVGLNPADPKIRAGLTLQGEGPQVLGFDAAGVVRAVGTGVEGFRPGDEVFYAGDVTRAGANAPLQVVDAAIVGKKPDSLDFEEAAALPLTSLTAWEVLFDRLEVPRDADERILVLGAAGGVGSVMLQALRAETA